MIKYVFYGDAAADIGAFLCAVERALGKDVRITDLNGSLKMCVETDDTGSAMFKGMPYSESEEDGGGDVRVIFADSGLTAEDAIRVYSFSECYSGLYRYETAEHAKTEKESMFIIRDSFGLMKKQASSISRRLSVSSVTVLKPDKNEHRARLALEMNGEIKPANTSPAISDIVFKLCRAGETKEEITEKQFRKAVKAVQKGGF